MKRGRWSHFFASLAIGLWMVLLAGSSFAAEEAKAPEPAKTEAPRGCTCMPQRQRRNCQDILLRRATIRRSRRHGRIQPEQHPASGRRQQAMAKAISRRNCRLRTSMIGWSITSTRSIMCGCRRRILGHVHAGWFHAGRNRSMPREERFSHRGYEPDDLSARLFGFLGLWFCDRLGQLVEWSGCPGLVSLARSRSVDAE